jgi:hypothetical protein
MSIGQDSLYDNALVRKSRLTPTLPYSGDTSGQVPALRQRQGEELGPFGVQPPSLGASTARWASWAPTAPQKPISDIIKTAMQGTKPLTQNPQLPQHPLGAYTDSQYEADNAVLEQQVNAAYQDVLSQTGYDSPQGHIAGDVELQAARKERDYLTGLMDAANTVTGEMQRAGTIFSGYHGAERARAEQPYVTGLGDLAVDTPRTLTRYYQQAEDLMRQYAVGQNQLLMQAAARRAAALAAQPAAATGATTAATQAATAAPTIPDAVAAAVAAGGQEAAIGAGWEALYPGYFGRGPTAPAGMQRPPTRRRGVVPTSIGSWV